ncbi:unnamed protein product [Durusdinium trenchii]|uniref:EF-hand domain-containing protein n=1 Tax=Durusdinium trenchii TaxID=1381693 RepID=A0ABP0JG38_9DINO
MLMAQRIGDDWRRCSRCEALPVQRHVSRAERSPIEEHPRPEHLAGTRTRDPLQGVPAGGKLVLSADCGGTTTRLMLYCVNWTDPVEKKRRAPGTLIREEKYPNIAFKSLQDIIKTFLFQDCALPEDAHPTVAVMAVAGVILNNQCRFTNLDWKVNGYELESELKIGKVELINDFVAQGYGMLTLADDEVTRLNDVEPEEHGTIACVGAGTGLGQCFLVADQKTGEYRCYPSEGQHGEFGPRGAGSDELKLELLKYLKIKFSNAGNRISTERVVSGTGICNIYEFLAYKHPHEVDEEVHQLHNERPKDAGLIAMNATPGSLCEKTLKIFSDAYGAQCATFALYVQPFGGIYITGGVTKKMREWLLSEGSFMKAYYDKGRLTPVLHRVPLMIVNSDDMGQRGAHLRAVMLLKSEVEVQARRLFDALDVNKDGVLLLPELEGLFEMAGNKVGPHRSEMAQRLMEDLDSDKNGVVSFAEFLKGYNHLPSRMISESAFLHDPNDPHKQEPPMESSELVSPPDRGNDPDSQLALAEELRKFQSKERRQAIDPFKDSHAPLFQTRLYKRLYDSDPAREDSWLHRVYWVSNSGGINYHSVTEGKALQYIAPEQVADISFRAVPDEKRSCKKHRFIIEPPPDVDRPQPATEFAAPSADILELWMIELEALKQKAQAAKERKRRR